LPRFAGLASSARLASGARLATERSAATAAAGAGARAAATTDAVRTAATTVLEAAATTEDRRGARGVRAVTTVACSRASVGATGQVRLWIEALIGFAAARNDAEQ